MCGFISRLSILFYWSVFLFLCQYHTVLLTIALYYSLKSGSLIPLALLLFLKISLAIWGLLYFYTNYKFFCPSVVKNAIGNLIKIAFNWYIVLGSIVTSTILILPVHKHGISLHQSLSFLISFISILQFSEDRSFASLCRHIPSYFILFVAVVSGIVSLISLSGFSLLAYRNARDFYVLIFYFAILSNSSESSCSFLVTSLGYSRYSIMSLANSGNFVYCFPIWIPLFLFIL